MTTRDTLHQIVDQLADPAMALADSAHDEVDPIDAATLASLDHGLADLSAGRVNTLDQYEHKRGM